MVVGLTTSLVLNTSADQAWKLFGENFGEHSAWSAAIKSSALDREAIGVGAVRTIDDKTLGPNTVQIITHFDREAMVIGWKFGCPPAPIVAITNQWKFEAVDATHCRGISDATFQPKCWALCTSSIIKRKMRASLQAFLWKSSKVLRSQAISWGSRAS